MRKLNTRRDHGSGQYVLCWLQQTLRALDNPAIDAAVTMANAAGVPCVVYHGIGERYPYASDRLHWFLIQASRLLEVEGSERGLTVLNYLERPSRREGAAVRQLASEAVCVVTDDQPVFIANTQAQRLAATCPIAVYGVNTGCVVAPSLLAADLGTTRQFRAAHTALRSHSSTLVDDVKPLFSVATGGLSFRSDYLHKRRQATLQKWMNECRIDHSLQPSASVNVTRGDIDQLLERLQTEVLPTYKYARNNPADPTSASRLSPLLHFGVIGPRTVMARVRESAVAASSRWKFLDELLTWREWFWYLAVNRKMPVNYSNVPAAARQTLADHAQDPRGDLYPLAQLLHGETHDETWNAAQKGFLLDGYMHNNLRMYWAKRLIEWTASPQAAWDTACYLNDRLAYDGRDPATYGNIEWVFGRGKRSYREAAVYGWVSKKSDRAMRKRTGVDEWLRVQAGRSFQRIDVPESVPSYSEPGGKE